MRYSIGPTLAVVGFALGCGKNPEAIIPKSGPPAVAEIVPAAPKLGERPTPPLELAVPPSPAATKDQPVENLLAIAKQAGQEKAFKKAIQYQFAAVQKGDAGQFGLYDLACFYGLDGDIPAALYWVQKAALAEGVDRDWANQDSDLDLVRRDPRWPAVDRYLSQCGEYWAVNGQPETVLLLPMNYAKDQAIPALVGLHGMGSDPASFMSHFKQDADALHVAFIGVSGSIPRGKKRYVWSPDTAKNAKRIDDALNEVAGKVTIKPRAIILFGFSQGAQASADVVVRNPEKYAGAILLSPGGLPEPAPATITDKARQQGFVLSVGAKELAGNVLLTRKYSALLRTAGARVLHKEYPNQAQHSFPVDFFEVLPEWIDFVFREKQSGP